MGANDLAKRYGGLLIALLIIAVTVAAVFLTSGVVKEQLCEFGDGTWNGTDCSVVLESVTNYNIVAGFFATVIGFLGIIIIIKLIKMVMEDLRQFKM